MKSYSILIILFFVLSGCTSTKLVNEWKSPDAINFEANKVLVIGLAQDLELRRQFEDQLTSKLEKKDVIAVRSVDFFEASFTDEKQSEEELNTIEQQLLDAGFDAILFSKVVGSENKVTLAQAIRNFDTDFGNFRVDYYESQDIFYGKTEYSSYTLYHAETNLYCICPEKERELLWSGNIDVIEASNRDKSVRDYVKTLVSLLEERSLLIVQP